MVTRETHGRAQEKRIARAMLESAEMTWTPNGASWIVTTASGNSYRVSPEAGTCTCHDYQQRCKGTEVRCKHAIALSLKLLAEGLLPEPVRTPDPAPDNPWEGLPAEEAAAFARIFS